MFEIHKTTKTGKIQQKILACGHNEKEAWDNFNQAQIAQNYPDKTTFVAIGSKSETAQERMMRLMNKTLENPDMRLALRSRNLSTQKDME